MRLRTGFWVLGALVVAVVMAGCATGAHKPPASSGGSARQSAAAASTCGEWLLLPAPRTVRFADGVCKVSERHVRIHGMAADTAGRIMPPLLDALTPPDAKWRYCKVTLRVDTNAVPHAQGYTLRIRPAHIEIVGHDDAGLFYGAQTLRQLAGQTTRPGVLPCLDISDWPDFPNRGIMLDVSRDKVPEMETLYRIVDMMARWKLNQLQLYTEHTFAYRGHHEVWEDYSPMTPHQIQELDAYCRAHFIELVPNQNSFGHLGRWLGRPKYRSLSEMPGGGGDLCAVDPACVDFLRGLYDDLLPNFSSHQINVGCDETDSLGKGRSAEAVQQYGVGRVYLGFLLKIHDLVKAHGCRMQFWGDIIMQHPELVPELPKDMIALEWGYEADHPFAEHGKCYADAGVSFYVCPGTSTWNSLVGRTDNAVKDLRNAAVNGHANGAIGYLITDWGDGGHWQYLSASYLGFSYGAGMSWCVDANKDMDIPRVLDQFAFRDSGHVMGKFAYDLGNAYLHTGALVKNGTTFYKLLLHEPEVPLSESLPTITRETMQDTIDYIDAVATALPRAKMDRSDADLVLREYRHQIALMKFACHLGQARCDVGGVPTSQLPAAVRAQLADELAPLIPEHRQLWLARNRSGGLKESAGGYERLLALLRSP